MPPYEDGRLSVDPTMTTDKANKATSRIKIPRMLS